ncbi:MAG: BACON domain-containing protein [Prevotella sp.]|nr:BACON domain-containing protein [Prevotella sp.]
MKKLFVLAWLIMLSIAAMAQSIVVVDKNGKRIVYDPSKITSVDFQTTPPGFTIHQNDGNIFTYIYDFVQSIVGSPNYVFANPETVEADADGESFIFLVNANVEYDATPSAAWITVSKADEGQHEVTAAMNPSVDEREGYVVLATKDGLLTDTVFVSQAGKDDSRYIDIDWEKNILDSFDSETGIVQITFANEVPIMGEYDVVLVPNEIGNLLIRVIESVDKVEGKTVTLNTMAGDMGNLFRDQEFTLELGDDGSASARSTDASSSPVIRPEKVEVFEDGRYIEVYNAAHSRGNRAPATEDLSIDCEGTYKTIWQGDDRRGVLQLDKYKLAMKMKGTISYTFKKEPWYKVWKSDVTKASVMLEGDWESETVLNTVSNTATQISIQPDGWASTDPMLQENIIQRRYTFTVDGIPVQVVLGGDLKCSYGVRLMGIADIKSGLKLGKHFKYGMALDTEKAQPDTYTCEETIDRTKTELIYPEMNAGTAEYKNSIAYGRADVYPIFNINFYGNGVESSFSLHEWLHSKTTSWEPEPEFAPGYLARRALVGRFRNIHMHMANIPNTIFELNQTYGENFLSDAEADIETLLRIPETFEVEQPAEPTNVLMQGEELDLKIRAFHYDHVSGEKIPTAGVLMEFETDESENNKVLKYTDEEGYASTKIKKGTKQVETLSFKLLLKEPELPNPVNEVKEYLKLLSFTIVSLTPSQQVEKGAKDVPVIFQLMKTEGTDVLPAAHQRIEFISTGGTVSPRYGTTDADGKVYAYVTPDEGVEQSTVKAIAYIKRNNVEWEGDATSYVWIKKDGGQDPCAIDDPDLQKANQLDNGYVVKNKKTGETQTRSYNPDYSEWTKTKDFITFQLNDEAVDAEGNLDTKGMVYGHIPLTMADVVLALTGQQFENTPGAKFGFGIYDGIYVSSDFMCTSGEEGSMTTEGDIKPDGKSKILIRKPCNQTTANAPRRAPGDEQEEDYTGDYELLYYLVFTTQAWNPETQQSEEVELEVYGKGTMKMHVPSITYFVLSNDKDWVRVGESTKVTLERYDEEGAVWDWNDVQLVGQSPDYSKARKGEDEGFFSWDAATQTLTSLKSNDNKDVWVYLGLKSNPEVKAPIQVATGEGWKYTMIGTSPEEITTHANSYPSFDIVWAPKDSDNESFDFNSVELDPECNPNNYFQFQTHYANQGWPLFVNYNCPPGVYNLKIRLKSNYNVNCTLKVTVTGDND